MNIECKAGKKFYDIAILNECIKHCESCNTIPPIRKTPLLYICPFCFKKSLFTHANSTYYECLNDKCLNHHVKIAYKQKILLQIEIEHQQPLI
jgi:hypothetical protein